ncbi:MAG: DNA repair protein RecO [Clostridiales bacterium]|jgi:DNA repair protein RecO|nr:DNA repair protein RecO [Clostridiales bacterium]
MDTTECIAILIQSQDYKEYDKRIKLLTADKGVIWCLLKGVKKSSAKLKSAGQPFACGTYTLTKKGSVVIGFVSLHEFIWLTSDYDNFLTASIACELAAVSSMGSESSLVLNSLLNFLKTLLTADSQISFKQYLKDTLSFVGFEKNYDNYSVRGLIGEFEQRLDVQINSAKLLKKDTYGR